MKECRNTAIELALIGNPNAGKSTLFNHLTGAQQTTGNWPGVTVDRKEGEFERAGKVFNIIRCMSLNHEQVRASMMMYQSCMFQPSGLSRAEREMIAVVVSRANDCHY